MRGSLGSVMWRYSSSDEDINEMKSGNIDVIKHNRKCRDLLFIVIFIAFWVAMIVNSSFGFIQGNPSRLIYGLDYNGNICGDKDANPDLHELEVQYWLNPNQVHQSGLKGTKFDLSNARSICLMECPTPSEDSLIWVCDYPDGDVKVSVDDWIDRNYDYFADLTHELKNTSLRLQGPCYPVIFPTINVYWTCQFVSRVSNVSLRYWEEMGGVKVMDGVEIDKSVHRSINSQSSVLKRYVADIGKAWPVLLVCGGFVPLFLSIIWLLMVRFFVAAMPWITVALFNVLVVSVQMFFYLKAGWIGNDAISPIIAKHDPYYHVSARELNHLHAAAILMTIITIISVLSSIAIVRRILMATSVLRVASRVIKEVHTLIVFPIIPYAVLAFFYVFWLSAAVHLLSTGRVIQNDCDLKAKELSCGYSIHYPSHIAASILFHLFSAYWATQFFIACSSTVIAGPVASYYWARREKSISGQPEITFLPVFSSLKRLMRYSLGSIALGSLIVSFIESIRFMLEAFRRKAKLVNASERRFGKLIYRSSQCLLMFIGSIIRSVNRNAYIMIAITGKGFFECSEIATELIVSNALRVGKVNVIGDVILGLGKLSISVAGALSTFFMLDDHRYKSSHHKISSPLFPVLVCWGFGYIVATLFFGVVEMSIDTIILSFCQDSDEHEGTAQYAPPLLMVTLNEQNVVRKWINH